MSRKFGLRKFLGNQDFLDYNPKEFWGNRIGGRGVDEIDNDIVWFDCLVSFFKEIECKSVLEIGSGGGTNLGFLKSKLPFLKCTGIDLSSRYVELSKKDYPGIEFRLVDLVKELPRIKSKSFDCVLCAGILMHVLPSKIDFVVKEIKRISSKAIFVYEQDKFKEFGLRHPNNFVFFYNYERLFKELDLVFKKEFKGEHFVFEFVVKEELKNGFD